MLVGSAFRIDVDVRVELLDRDFVAARLQKFSRRGADVPSGAAHSACDKDVPAVAPLAGASLEEEEVGEGISRVRDSKVDQTYRN